MTSVLSRYHALDRRALIAGAWHVNRGRLLLSIVGVALGVALGAAVHLINRSAVDEFSSAARHLSGDADLMVRGPLGGFDETIYPRIARLVGIAVASPALELDMRVPGKRPVHLVAIDSFQALRIQPGLFGSGFDGLQRMLESDAIVLSRSAADDLGVVAGGRLAAQVGTSTVDLRVIAVLPAEVSAQRVAYADIATAQWRLQRMGSIDRIDIRLAPGVDRTAVEAQISAMLPPGIQLSDVDVEAREAVAMTRAYRINLDMLALVALFTGSFLVFATQALTILQRRPAIAILRVLGVTRAGIVRILVIESVLIGAIGSAVGLGIGYALASLALSKFGGDLGAGYFSGVAVRLHPDPIVLGLYFVLGVAASVTGCVMPAWKAATSPPAPALKAAGVVETMSTRPAWPGIASIALALPLSMLPAIDGLPLGGYAAVAVLLAGALWLVPFVSDFLLSQLPRMGGAVGNPVLLVAVQQLRGANNQIGISIAAIVVSFSLMAAMLIMIGSFRGSLERWLEDILPADAYVRAGGAYQSGFIDPATLQKITSLPSVARASAMRTREVRIAPDRLPVTVLARDFATDDPLMLARPRGSTADDPRTVTQPPPEPALPPAWISEAASDLHGWKVGATIELPLGNSRVPFAVVGLWRDYARQNGSIVIERARYIEATGDVRVNDVWVWLAPGATIATLSAEVERTLGASGLVDIRDAGSIRRFSLAMFDRTFAVTYLLEGVAVIIGLFGISVGFSSQVLARRGEFGVLRHIGVTRAQIASLLGIEGLVAGCIGVAYGLVTGGAISFLLVHVINRQSFHWSMDLHVPVVALAAVSAVLVIAATLTAVTSGRQAMSGQPIAAVKEDW